MKTIPLTQGEVTIVDDEDFEWLSQWKWRLTKLSFTSYAVRSEKRIPIYMHREITGLKINDNRQADHINHNGLDNCRCNLRICTHSQNLQNSKKRRKATSSRYKGVHWHKRKQGGGWWISRIVHNYKEIFLGNFKTEIEAATAYDSKAKKLFGEFAHLNFPKEIAK